jgi:hypothetical protein
MRRTAEALPCDGLIDPVNASFLLSGASDTLRYIIPGHHGIPSLRSLHLPCILPSHRIPVDWISVVAELTVSGMLVSCVMNVSLLQYGQGK